MRYKAVEMIEYLKRHIKKTIDIYDLAFEYKGKSFQLWSQDEINDFLLDIQELYQRGQSIILGEDCQRPRVKVM